MERRDANLLLSVLALALALAFAVAPRTVGQSQRGDCQKSCEVQYQECRRGTNANEAACKAAFDSCKAGCQNVHGNQNENVDRKSVV